MEPEFEPMSEENGEESIESLFRILEAPLLGYAFRFLASNETSEDVVQEAFMRLHEQWSSVQDKRAWLYRTVHNLALNRCRERQKIVPLETLGSAPGPSGFEIDSNLMPDEEVVRAEGIKLVKIEVQKLDDRERNLIKLKFEDGLSYKEISSKTGLTVSHVGYLLHHSIKSLASKIAKAGLIP